MFAATPTTSIFINPRNLSLALYAASEEHLHNLLFAAKLYRSRHLVCSLSTLPLRTRHWYMAEYIKGPRTPHPNFILTLLNTGLWLIRLLGTITVFNADVCSRSQHSRFPRQNFKIFSCLYRICRKQFHFWVHFFHFSLCYCQLRCLCSTY